MGDAIRYGRKHVDDEPFAVLLGHSITKSQISCIKQLIDIYDKYKASTVALAEVPKEKADRYRLIDGIEVENGIYKITDITERHQNERPSELAVIGRLILTPDIFEKIGETEEGIDSEIHLTDALLKLDSLYGAVFKGKSYYIDSRMEWLKASIEFGLDDREFRDELIRYMENYAGK